MKRITRREFAKITTVVVGAPAIVPSSVFGVNAPSNRITMGFIGVGNQGTNDMRGFLQDDRVQVVAVCDVNKESNGYWSNAVGGREPARRIVNEFYARKTGKSDYSACEAYEDFHELITRRDIDAVETALPDHWHAIPVIEAAKAGKDIYGQKPLSLTVADGRAMVRAVQRYNRVFQCGSQQRSDWNFRRACELVRNGRIGKLQTVECGLPGGTPDYVGTNPSKEPEPIPEGFNYNFWLGPAPEAPYCPARCHVNFRWILDYSGGQVTDWGGHHPDCAQWGMGTELTGPVKIINAKGKFNKNDLWNTATEYTFDAVYVNGVILKISNRLRGGVKFIGTDGWIWANRGQHEASSEEIKNSTIGPDEIQLYKSDNHFRNFIDCVISRKEPVAPIEVAHRSITIAHLGNIAMLLGRDLQWDPKRERVINDTEANTMLARPYRAPWRL
ncbi:MAG: Gfo/Idh/MocA family oxidoreductase [Sedimentisphaerales bacterium]|nr:Gfo/Idh/MocA family oxidoreductase [Sedimentisphaerales bacterium]